MLVGCLRVGRRANLRRNRRHDNRLLEHLQVCLLFILRRDVPCWWSLICRRDTTVERVIFLRLFLGLFLHAFDRIELVGNGWPF